MNIKMLCIQKPCSDNWPDPFHMILYTAPVQCVNSPPFVSLSSVMDIWVVATLAIVLVNITSTVLFENLLKVIWSLYPK